VLDYELNLAPHEKNIIQNAVRFNKPIPKKFQNSPRLEPSERLYYIAYNDLTTCRNFELGPIPLDKILFYCDNYNFDDEQTDIAIEVIRRVDVHIIGEEMKKLENSSGKGNSD